MFVSQHHRLWAQNVIEHALDIVVHDDDSKLHDWNQFKPIHSKSTFIDSHGMKRNHDRHCNVAEQTNQKLKKRATQCIIIVTSLTRKATKRRSFQNQVFTSRRFKPEKELLSNSDCKIGSQFLTWWALIVSTGATGTLIKYFEVDRVSATNSCSLHFFKINHLFSVFEGVNLF